MSIMPSPDTLVKSVLDNRPDSMMHVYNMEKTSVLKTPEKSEIMDKPPSNGENTETERSDSSAVKEILDIFPGATVKK